jgi:hypothetical protein
MAVWAVLTAGKCALGARDAEAIRRELVAEGRRLIP